MRNEDQRMAPGSRRGEIRSSFFSACALLFAVVLAGCARQGLLTRTLPPERLPAATRVTADTLAPRFLVYGDNRPDWRVAQKFLSRSSWLTWRMALVPFYQIYWLGNGVLGTINLIRRLPDYGDRESRRVARAMLAYASRNPVDFVLNTGDIVTDGRYPILWRRFLQQTTSGDGLLRRLPFVPVAGNHEDTNDRRYGEPNYRAALGYPRFYALQFRYASLIVIDSDILVDQDGYLEDSEQERLFRKWIAAEPQHPPAWLERQLAASTKPFRIVAMHHPPISFGKHHRDWYKRENGPGLLEKRDRFLAVLRRYGVQLLLAGHEHLFEHSVTVPGGREGVAPQPLHTVVLGGGGTPLRPETGQKTIAEFAQNFRSRGLEVRLLKHKSVHHFGVVTVAPEVMRVEVWQVPKDTRREPAVIHQFEIAVQPQSDGRNLPERDN